MKSKLPSPQYLNIIPLVQVGIHFLLPTSVVIHSPWRYLGIVIVFIAFALNIKAVKQLKVKSTINFSENAKNLETVGVYQMSRNPIYLSGVVLSVGISIIIGTKITFLFPLVLFIILDKIYIPIEEKRLEDLFGQKYLHYKKRVRRWI